ncbi:serine/arginine repetitive matrix protein 2-like [Procambarus clarkii]|uniref:serine/arginine repetitive matrix protein 2-like n=1 Tax=Procambarus clarkii TaxID=6728 RepID=UPI0037423CE3
MTQDNEQPGPCKTAKSPMPEVSKDTPPRRQQEQRIHERHGHRKKSRQNKPKLKGPPPTEDKKENPVQRRGRSKWRKNRPEVKQCMRQLTNGADITPRPKASRSGSVSAAQIEATVCKKSMAPNPHQKSQADANKCSHLRRDRRKRKDRQNTPYCYQEKHASGDTNNEATRPPTKGERLESEPNQPRQGSSKSRKRRSHRKILGATIEEAEPETQAGKDGDGTSVEQKTPTPQRERTRQEIANYGPDARPQRRNTERP